LREARTFARHLNRPDTGELLPPPSSAAVTDLASEADWPSRGPPPPWPPRAGPRRKFSMAVVLAASEDGEKGARRRR